MTGSSAATPPGEWSCLGWTNPSIDSSAPRRWLAWQRPCPTIKNRRWYTCSHTAACAGGRWPPCAEDAPTCCVAGFRSPRLAEISGRLVFGPTKTYQTRTAHLPPFVAEMLGRHLESVEDDPQKLVFTAPQGGPLRYTNTRRRAWNPAREAAGDDLSDITPHDLRHTCASLMRAAGADVKAIQQQLGHRNATVTLNTYTHLFEGDLADVMDRLDAHPAPEPRPERVLAEVVELRDTSEKQV
jgi:hypothetical protein